MTVELSMLLYTTLLFFVLVVVRAGYCAGMMGLPWAFGNREEPARSGAFVDRITRAVENHKEGLLLFIPLVVIVAATDGTTSETALGAQIYFWARLAHAVTYAAGIAYVRSGAYVVGVVGLAMMLIGLM